MTVVDRNRLLTVLYGYNSWWRSGTVPKDFIKPVKRFAYYEAHKVLHHKSIRRTIVLSGARRVGKTTIQYQLISDLLDRGVHPKNILYVSFDHPMLKFSTVEQILDIFENEVSGDDSGLYIFFDEVHYASEWSLWLKHLYDHRPDCKVVATGSASPTLETESAESGVGRWTTIKVPTLSFYEYCELVNHPHRPQLPDNSKITKLHQMSERDFKGLIMTLAPLQKAFHRYLVIGGFPEIALSDDLPFAQRILREDIVDKVLKRDMTALFGVRNIAELEKVFVYLCIHSGSIIAIDTIAKEIQLSRPTVSSYIGLLESANLLYISDPIEMGGMKILKARPKVYIADAAIRNAVLMMDDAITDPNELGIMAETSVYKHIADCYKVPPIRVGYYRQGKTEKEVNVVVAQPRGQLLFEVKYWEQSRIGESEAIVALAKVENNTAFVITKNSDDSGPLPYKTSRPILRIPAFAFLYLLGHDSKLV